MAEISPARTAAFRILSRLHEKPDDQTPLPALLGMLGGDAGIDAEDISTLLSRLLSGRSLEMDHAEQYLACD